MAKALRATRWERALVLLTGIGVAVVIIVALSWAQVVLMPVALAIFFTFLLSPVVTMLQQWMVGRITAVAIATTLTFLVVGCVFWITVSQISSLVTELPTTNYGATFMKKVDRLRSRMNGPLWERLESTLDNVNHTPVPATAEPPSDDTTNPVRTPVVTPVVVNQSDPLWMRFLAALFRPTLETLGQFGLTAVLVIFMLLKREDFRNRFIRLVGHGRMTVTTKAVDDASQRISRFLLMQFFLTVGYGAVLGVCLAIIGIKYALLWGFIVGMMRYIPYIGAPLTSLFPIALSLGQFDSWWPALIVIALIVGMELITANIIEPRVYGRSIGVSEVALLVSAAFWAFLWGPVGLILSCPLTVCLVVLGKYVPQLEFLAVLLGDEPTLPEDIVYYQRLAAKDQDEAYQVALAAAETQPLDQLYDKLVLPALHFASRDRQHDLLDADDVQFIQQATLEVLEELDEQYAARQPKTEEKEPAVPEEAGTKVRILGVPAYDRSDELALEMLRRLLDPNKWDLQIASVEDLTGEVAQQVEDEQSSLICIASLPPGGLAHVRYLCKRLRGRFPHLQIIVGRWGRDEADENQEERLKAAGADRIETTLQATRQHLNGWRPALIAREEDAKDAPSPASRHGDCSTVKQAPLSDKKGAVPVQG